jgi:hypothetical protein
MTHRTARLALAAALLAGAAPLVTAPASAGCELPAKCSCSDPQSCLCVQVGGIGPCLFLDGRRPPGAGTPR